MQHVVPEMLEIHWCRDNAFVIHAFCRVVHGKRKVTASDPHSSFSDVDRYSYRIDVRWCWAVLRAPARRVLQDEEYRSDDQEQEDVDGTGEVEHWIREKRSPRRYMVVTEL